MLVNVSRVQPARIALQVPRNQHSALVVHTIQSQEQLMKRTVCLAMYVITIILEFIILRPAEYVQIAE